MDGFREEISTLMPRLRAFARCLARNRELGDDLLQDTILLALQAQKQFTPGTDLRAWLFTIMHNRFRSMVGRRRFPWAAFDQNEVDRVYNAPAFQEGVIEVAAFRRAFAQLGWTHREVLVLVGVHGMSYEQMAVVCGCEVGTVKSRINRARSALKKELLGDGAQRRRGRPLRSAGMAGQGAESSAAALAA
jgi:RNA polymerase sigma-70 factor (ECF subfamily)